MDAKELADLVARGEGETVEFKRRLPPPADLARLVTAFANSKGGKLIVGVDDAGRVIGVDPDELRPERLERVVGGVQARTAPPADVRVEPATLDGKRVLVVHVSHGDNAPYTVREAGSGAVYVRRGAAHVPAAPADLRRLALASSLGAFEDAPVPGAAVSDLDPLDVRAYFAKRSPTGAPPDAILGATLLRNAGFAAGDPGDPEPRPTVAAVLLFGREPQRFLPQARVVTVRFAGEKPPDEADATRVPTSTAGFRPAADARRAEAIVERAEIAGTLPQQLEQALDFVRRHMRVGSVVRGFGREDVPEYPLGVMRELLVNALVHRDYALSGAPVQVRMYADRWEVESPGRLPGPLTVASVSQGSERYARNPRIADTMRVLGFAEGLGLGLRAVRRELRAAGFPPPTVTEGAASLTVTLAGSVGASDRADLIARHRNALAHGGGNARQHQALEYLAEHDSITNAAYRRLTRTSQITALRDLSDLVERGVLERHGEKRGAYYRLATGRLDRTV